ncbi:FAD-binding domain containing protein [Amanita muscaria]
MMKSCWLTVLPFVVAIVFCPLARAGPRCKCLSFQPCWPSPSNFSQLASQVSQPLIYPVPPASACYPPFDSSSRNCTDIQSHLQDDSWRSNIPGAMISINFESYTFDNGTIDACYYNFLLGIPCHQGNVAVIGVDARSVSDIQAAVNFSTKFDLRLVVKNTGHDYLSRSMARGAFMLWTHNLKDIAYDDAFLPTGAPANALTNKALTVGAGVQWNEAYPVADSHERAVVGGSCPSVGAGGGWVQGGGHGYLSPSFGLGVDNAIQFTVVLANGQYVTANEYQYQDLFWALRGGGGGTYGVVASVTYRTHDIQPTTVINLNMTYPSPGIAQSVTTELVKTLPVIQNASWGGRYMFSPNGFLSNHFAPDNAPAQGNATFNSFVERARAAGAVVTISRQSTSSFYAAWSLVFRSNNTTGGNTTELSSRFLSMTIAEKQPEQAANVILGMKHNVSLLSAGGGTVSQIDPDSVGLTPAWRQAVGVLVFAISWPEGTSTAEINRMRSTAAADLESLDTISPNSGAYLNEASLYEKNFQNTFFGSHYPRLKAIKSVYDPNDLFIVTEGVGSDDWDQSLNCRLN